MEGLLSVTKSVGDDVSVPMAMARKSADAPKGESGSCRLAGGDVLVCPVRTVLPFP